jgi:hypothetical protein
MKQCNRNRLFGWLALVFLFVVLLYFLPLLFFEARPETATFYVFAGGILGIIVLRPDPLFAGALFSAVAGAALTLATFADPVLFGTLSMVLLAVALFLVLKREMHVACLSALPTIITHTALVFSVTKYGHLPFT